MPRSAHAVPTVWQTIGLALSTYRESLVVEIFVGVVPAWNGYLGTMGGPLTTANAFRSLYFRCRVNRH